MGAPIEFDEAALADARTLAERLHDGLSQQLFAAELDLHELRGRADLPADVRVVLDRLSDRLTVGSRQLREALLGVLTAPEGECRATPLPEALAEVTAACAADCPAVAVTVRVTGEGPEPSPAAAGVLLRAAREGLANVVKHAGAAHALVLLRRGRDRWTVEVHDDGGGDPAAVRASIAAMGSFGLCSLTSNVERVDGRLAVLASPELGGIALTVSLPVANSATGR